MGQTTTPNILTLNLLHQSYAAPTISAWQYVHGNFDYNKMPLAPMGCAVQLYQSSERRATWAANTIDGWYLQTLPERYQCHIIYVKQTKSKRVSDTVFFKTKFITQPTMTPADVITKALNDLTQALQGKKNHKGLEQIEALTKLDNMLNNTPEPDPLPELQAIPAEPRRDTFDETTKPPQNEEPTTEPRPRVKEPTERRQPEPHKVMIDKAIPNMLTPRVAKLKTSSESNDNREQIRRYMATKTMLRIPQQNTHLQKTTQISKQTQLIHDEETNTYLNYRQLM